MPMLVFHAHRRPDSSREAMAGAALDFCRAVKEIEGARARFYWTGTDSLAFLVEGQSYLQLNRAAAQSDDQLLPAVEKARFALADSAEIMPSEVWREPNAGVAAYQAAGR